jgi:pimeloyl-ACP methyl ester carboxylesterase
VSERFKDKFQNHSHPAFMSWLSRWTVRWILVNCFEVCLLPLAGILLAVAWVQRWWWWWWPRTVHLHSKHTVVPTNAKIGVLLLHGSGFNRTEWLFGRAWLAWTFPSGVFSVHAIDYAGLISNAHGDGIDMYARGPIHQQLVQLSHQTGIKRWCLVGHSMGGTAAVYYFVNQVGIHAGIQVLHVDTIGSPWQGAPVIDWLTQETLPVRYQQMQAGSTFLANLRRDAYPYHGSITTYGSDVDFMVPGHAWAQDPNDPTNSDRTFFWVGHYGLVACPALWHAITARLISVAHITLHNTTLMHMLQQDTRTHKDRLAEQQPSAKQE